MEANRKAIRALYPELGERGIGNATIVHKISRVGIEGYIRQFTGNKRELRRAIKNIHSIADAMDKEFFPTDEVD
jgi:hypothetical protein